MITSQQLQEFLTESGIQPFTVLIADDNYSLPDPQWILNDFANALRSFQLAMETATYMPEKNDCDNFTRGAAYFADVLHSRTRDVQTAICFGEFWYTLDAGGGHAINIAVVKNGDVMELMFFEPQTLMQLTLSKTEIESCYAYRF